MAAVPQSRDDVARRHAGHLVDRRLAEQHFAPTVHAQGDHAFLQRLVADGAGVDPLDAHLADTVACNHQLVNTRSAAEAALAAGPTASPLPEADRAVALAGEVAGHLV